MAQQLAITLPEYERIFRVVHSVSRSLDDRAGASCLFYNTVGAILLEQRCGIPARPAMGSAFIRVDDSDDATLAFASMDSAKGEFEGTQEAFHCWIETGDHIIDFTAPVYREYFDKLGAPRSVPRKMFQKRYSKMADSPRDLVRVGDFFVEQNIDLTRHFLESAMKSPALGDLANVCLEWFVRPPKAMKDSISIMNDLGEVTHVRAAQIHLTGAW
jgi:hypothetical protein